MYVCVVVLFQISYKTFLIHGGTRLIIIIIVILLFFSAPKSKHHITLIVSIISNTQNIKTQLTISRSVRNCKQVNNNDYISNNNNKSPDISMLCVCNGCLMIQKEKERKEKRK